MTANTGIIYGDTGSSKTTQLGFIARYLYEKTGKPSRMISCDPGGAEPIKDLVKAGIIDLFEIANNKDILCQFRWLSRGAWPSLEHQGQFLPANRNGLTEGKIAGVFLDSLSGLADRFLEHIARQDTKISSQDAPWRYEENGEKFAGNSMGHYNVVQQTILDLVANGFRNLPVSMFVCTALTDAGEDRTRQTRYGPKLAGSAKTAYVPSWFGDCIYIHKFNEQQDIGGVKVQVTRPIAFFSEFVDPQTAIRYLAKPRVQPHQVPKMLEKFPGGMINLGFTYGMDQYYKVIDSLGKDGEVEKWKQEVDQKKAEQTANRN